MKSIALIFCLVMSSIAFTQVELNDEELMKDSTSIDSTQSNDTKPITDTGFSVKHYWKNINWYQEKGNYKQAIKECDIAFKKKSKSEFLMHKAELKIEEFVYTRRNEAFNFWEVNEELHTDTSKFEPPLHLPSDLVKEIISIWKQANQGKSLDYNTKFNIGHFYSISNMDKELELLLPELRDKSKDQELTLLMMGTLAKNFRERGDFNRSVKIYRQMSFLYPRNGQISADIAGEYYAQGKIDTALIFINRAMEKEDLTLTTLDNAFLLYSMSENYDRAYSVLEKMADMNGTHHELFYQGVVDLLQDKKNWQKNFKVFLKGKYDENDPTAKVCEYMISEDFKLHSHLSYKKITGYDIHDGVEILFHKKFFKEFPEQFYFLENIIKLYTEHHFYDLAIQYYKDYPIEDFHLPSPERHRYLKHIAYAYNQKGEDSLAVTLWEDVYSSIKPELHITAAYFLGKYHMQNGDSEKAFSYFSAAKKTQIDSKFHEYCSFWMNYIKEEKE